MADSGSAADDEDCYGSNTNLFQGTISRGSVGFASLGRLSLGIFISIWMVAGADGASAGTARDNGSAIAGKDAAGARVLYVFDRNWRGIGRCGDTERTCRATADIGCCERGCRGCAGRTAGNRSLFTQSALAAFWLRLKRFMSMTVPC